MVSIMRSEDLYERNWDIPNLGHSRTYVVGFYQNTDEIDIETAVKWHSAKYDIFQHALLPWITSGVVVLTEHAGITFQPKQEKMIPHRFLKLHFKAPTLVSERERILTELFDKVHCMVPLEMLDEENLKKLNHESKVIP